MRKKSAPRNNHLRKKTKSILNNQQKKKCTLQKVYSNARKVPEVGKRTKGATNLLEGERISNELSACADGESGTKLFGRIMLERG